MPSYKMIIYILFCVFVGLAPTMQLMRAPSNRIISATVYLILAILIFVFFGLRWFGSGSNESSGQWPPIVNMCPDYLTLYNRVKSDRTVEKTCIDMVGVSTNCGISKWVDSDSGHSDDKYYFSLAGSMQEKCKRAKDKGLSWEACDTFSPTGTIPSGSTCVPT
jgi:hypothetical protein